MSDQVGVASVGVGWWGRELARAAAHGGRLRLVSCYARTAETRRSFAADHDCRTATSLDELLADEEVEGILIATSNDSRRSLVEAAASAGKHIFVDKPLALTVDDGRAAVDAATAAGVILQVGHQRRRLAAHREIKTLIDQGKLGDIQMLEADHSLPNRIPDGAWRWDPDQSPLGSMTSLGIHQIDNFHYLAGPIAGVSAITRPGRPGVSSIDEATAVMFDFESGALGVLTTSFFTPWSISLAVHGTEGAAFADHDGSRLAFQAVGDDERKPRPLVAVDPVVSQLVEFADSITNGTKPEVGGEEGLEVVAVLVAAAESAVAGRRVAISEIVR